MVFVNRVTQISLAYPFKILVILKVTRLSKSKIIIDWHNYGYSIMRVNHVNKALVFLGKVYEMRLAKFADYHLCVSRAMQTDLVHKFGIARPPLVLYDKATAKFQQALSLEDMHQLFTRAGLTDGDKTLFTERQGGQAKYRKDRPVFLLSSTSYTPDEDFMILVKALDELHDKVQTLRKSSSFRFPKIQVVVTGKGPQKDHYL